MRGVGEPFSELGAWGGPHSQSLKTPASGHPISYDTSITVALKLSLLQPLKDSNVSQRRGRPSRVEEVKGPV